MKENLKYLKVLVCLIMVCFLSWSGRVIAAGCCSSPAISSASVSTTGTWTCHISDSADKVDMTATGHDYDDPPPDNPNDCDPTGGDRIDLAATEWEIASGTLSAATGSSSSWTAGSSTGKYTLTVTFKDLDDGEWYDDDDKEVQKELTAFKVGVHISTSGGSSHTTWEDGTANQGFLGNLDLGLNVLTSPEHTHAVSTTCTWALEVHPDNTAIKGNIKAWAHASGGPGYIKGVAADSDSFDDGDASFSITVSVGLVSFSYSQSLSDDDNLSVCSVGAGFGSEIHADYETKIELVSSTTTGPSENKSVSHTPSDAAITGKPDTSKQAEWELGCKMQKKTTGGNWAAAESDGEVQYVWKNGELPTYIPMVE